MLAYARYHGLACPFTTSLEALAEEIHQETTDESVLPPWPFPRDSTTMHLFFKEQLRITRDAAVFLTEFHKSPDIVDVATLEFKILVDLDYPLEPRNFHPDFEYTVPHSYAEVCQEVHCLSVVGSEQSVLDEIKCIMVQPCDSCLWDKFVLSKESATFLSEIIRPTEELSVLAPEIHSTKIEQSLEMPLLPLTSKDTAMDVFMAGDLNSISQFIAPEYLKEEILELVSESMEESSSFLMEVLGEAEQPSQVEEITHRIPLEFEMPLSPRYPAVCESLIAVERPKRELEDIFEKPKHELDVSSSTANLFEAFGLSEHAQIYDPTREEQLTLFDTALRITEPPVKAITLQQGLRKLPVSMSSLRRPKNDTGVMYVVEIIPAKHLDIHVRWTPFINSAHRYSIEEYLEGGDLVNDFVDIEDESELEQFEGLIDQELLQEPTTPLHRQSSPVPWADTSFKAVEVNLTPDGAALPLNQGSGKRLTLMDYETPRPSYDHKFRDHDRLQGVMKQDAKVLNLLEDETVSHSLHPDSVYVSENEQQCHKLSSSCGIKFQMLQGSDLPNLSTNISWAMSDSAPDQSKLDLLPRDHSNARSTEEVAELSDDSLTRLLRRRKRARQLEASPEVEVEVEDQGGHCRGNIDDYIRLNNNQSPPKIKTQKAVKRPKKQPLPIQRPESTQARQEIVPTLDKSDEAGRIWMISSTLLQQSTLIRQLRERNPGVTFIERDLDSMKEADLILSSTSGIALLHIEHLLRSDTHREGGEVLMPAQLRMLNLSSRYSSLCLVILFNGSLTFDQRKALVEFQGWLSSKLTVTVILSGSHSEQLSYLDYFATKYAPNLVTCGTATGEEDVENPHEAFLRACPLLNAMSAYLILQHCSLLDFLAFNINERRELLSSIGVVLDSQALGIHAYFCASWHETEKLNLQA